MGGAFNMKKPIRATVIKSKKIWRDIMAEVSRPISEDAKQRAKEAIKLVQEMRK
jgi:hypothetical protein